MKILIIDDELSILEILKWMLEDKGHKIQTTNNIVEGLEIIQASKLDLVISDIQMAQGSGIELLDRCKEQGIDIPIILMSGFFNLPKSEIIEKGARDILTKPVDFDKLDEVIAQI